MQSRAELLSHPLILLEPRSCRDAEEILGGSGWLSTLPPCHKVRVDKLGGSKDKTTAPPEQICSYFGGTMGQTDRQSSPSPWHRPSGTVPVPYTQAQILPASIKPSEKGFMEAKPSLGSC